MGSQYESNTKLIGAALAVILSSNASGIYSVANIRDSFSELNGAQLEARLINRINNVDRQVSNNTLRVNECMKRAETNHEHQQ